MTALVAALAGVAGLGAGVLVNRAAGRFPWPSPARPADVLAGGRTAARPPWVEAGTALLCLLTAVGIGPSWALPAYLVAAVAGVLLALVDARHRLLPDRVVLPATALTAALLVPAAAVEGAWPALVRALLGGLALFVVLLVLALAAPGQLGMGDVKLGALLGLVLAWPGWPVLLLGVAAGFVVQAVVALVLLAARRITLRGHLPFGPALLAGAALAIGLGTLGS
ncbi:prepilin peptidase [Blastococcus sp. SYSU D00820]